MHTIPNEGKSQALRIGLAVVLFLALLVSSIGMNNAIESSIAGQDQSTKLALMALLVVLSTTGLVLTLLYRGGDTAPAGGSSWREVKRV